jgi:hypothetical protein
MARQGMMNMIQVGQNNGLPGSAAQNMAANISQGQATMGRDFENYDYSGQLSSQQQYINAAQAGMSRGQYIKTMQQDPGKAQSIQMGSKLQAASNILPPQMMDAIKQKIKEAGQKVDEPIARQIATQILNQFPDYWNPDLWRGYVATSGADPNATADLLLADLIMTIAGQDPQMQAQNQKTSSQPQPAKPDSKGNLPSGVQTSQQGYMDQKQYQTWQDQGKSGSGHGAAQALASVESKGGRNRVLEGILQNTQHADHTTVEVHTKDGARVVSLEDAIKNHPEELASGSVRFMQGSNAGKTVSDVLGASNVDSNTDWTKESAGSKDTSGQSLDDYKKDHPDKTQGGGTGSNGTVVIDLTAAAKQMLQVQSTTGAAQSADAAGTGAPVQNDYNNNPTRNGSYGG